MYFLKQKPTSKPLCSSQQYDAGCSMAHVLLVGGLRTIQGAYKALELTIACFSGGRLIVDGAQRKNQMLGHPPASSLTVWQPVRLDKPSAPAQWLSTFLSRPTALPVVEMKTADTPTWKNSVVFCREKNRMSQFWLPLDYETPSNPLTAACQPVSLDKCHQPQATRCMQPCCAAMAAAVLSMRAV